MITPIASKYANALLNVAGSEIDGIILDVQRLAQALAIPKMHDIIHLSDDKNKTLDFLLSLCEGKSKKLHDFLSILDDKNKLSLLPQILSALELAKANSVNEYRGKVYSSEDISKDILKTLEEKLSSTTQKQITLFYEKSDFSGIRVEVDMLNIEISFSKNQIKNKLIDHILKSI